MGKGVNGNLIPANERTEKELREQTRNGGIKSGEARRRKKTMREALEMLMYNAKLSETTKQMLQAEGIKDTESMNHQMVITRSLIAKAEAGDVQAYNAICAMIGEKPAEKVEMSGGMQTEIRIKYVGGEGDEVFPSSEADVDMERG
jgi:hypothetical protein